MSGRCTSTGPIEKTMERERMDQKLLFGCKVRSVRTKIYYNRCVYRAATKLYSNKVTKTFPKTRLTQEILVKVSKEAKIRNRYNQVIHLTQNTNGKVTNPQLYATNQSQEVSPFPAGDHKAQINKRTQRHNKHKTEKSIKDQQKKYCLRMVSKIFYGGLQPVSQRQPHPSDVDQAALIIGLHERPLTYQYIISQNI